MTPRTVVATTGFTGFIRAHRLNGAQGVGLLKLMPGAEWMMWTIQFGRRPRTAGRPMRGASPRMGDSTHAPIMRYKDIQSWSDWKLFRKRPPQELTMENLRADGFRQEFLDWIEPLLARGGPTIEEWGQKWTWCENVLQFRYILPDDPELDALIYDHYPIFANERFCQSMPPEKRDKLPRRIPIDSMKNLVAMCTRAELREIVAKEPALRKLIQKYCRDWQRPD